MLLENSLLKWKKYMSRLLCAAILGGFWTSVASEVKQNGTRHSKTSWMGTSPERGRDFAKSPAYRN
jgi:hypothetical protein